MPVDYAFRNESNPSHGGTEQMARALEAGLPPDLLDRFHIVVSRDVPPDPARIPVFWAHELPGEPGSEHLRDGGWQRYARLVFVSHWQMQAHIAHYRLPWAKCQVLQNAIEPFTPAAKPAGRIRLIYHTTPHRGLHLLVAAFKRLAETDADVHLDVYSSFGVYGRADRDAPFRPLFDEIAAHPRMSHHGAVPNAEVRAALARAHVFAYPSVFPETSCLALIEAMGAGLVCVHPGYAALAETAANWTWMYAFSEDVNEHASRFLAVLRAAVEACRRREGGLDGRLESQAAYVRLFYDRGFRLRQWEAFLRSLLASERPAGRGA